MHVPEPLEQMVLSIFIRNNDRYFFYWSTVSRLVASINNAQRFWKRVDFSPGWQKCCWSLFFAFQVVRFVRTLLSWIWKLFQRLNINNRWLLVGGSCGRCSGSGCANFRFRLFYFCLLLVEFRSWFWDFEEAKYWFFKVYFDKQQLLKCLIAVSNIKKTPRYREQQKCKVLS